jgi:hypothetical protein
LDLNGKKMKYSSRNCPQCGVELHGSASSADGVRRCEACGFQFGARKSFLSSVSGWLGNLFSLVAVCIFILACCGAVALFIFAMNNFGTPLDAEPAAGTVPEVVVTEPAVTPPEPVPEAVPEARTEPPPAAEPEPPQESKQPPATETRMWTDKTGQFTTEARFGGMAGGTVTLHKSDGTTAKIPFDQLSPADQEWIERRRKNPTRKPQP